MTGQLRRRPLYWVTAATFLLIALPYIAPVVSADTIETYSGTLVDVPLMILIVLFTLVRRPRDEDPSARRFWHLIGIGFAAWLAARMVYILSPGPQRIADLCSDFLFWCLYVCLFIAIEMRPSEPRPSPHGRQLRAIAIWAGIVMLAGTYLYFSLAPALLQVQEYESWIPSYLLSVILDAYLTIRFFRLARQTPTGAWRSRYMWITASFALWFVFDALEVWCRLDTSILQNASYAIDLLWATPFLPLAIAVILGRRAGPPGTDPAPVIPSWGATSSLRNSPLIGYVFIMPAVHLALGASGLLTETLHSIRDMILLTVIVVVASLLYRYQHHVQRETVRLEAERARAMGQLNAMNRDLDRLAEQRARDLTSTQERIVALTRAVPDTMYLLGRDGIIREVHPGGDQGTGVGEVGCALAEQVPRNLRAQVGAALETVFRTGHEQIVSCPVPAEMGQRSLELRIVSANEDEALVIVRDLTRQRRIELAMQRTQKIESLGVLAGGIAHDFNNLLAAILGQTQLALSGLEPDSPLHEPLIAIKTSANRSAKLTTKLLAYTGRARVDLASQDLAVLLDELSPLLSSALGMKTSLSLDVQTGPVFVDCDETQFTQVLLNLIVNADEALGADGGLVSIILDRIGPDPDAPAASSQQAQALDEPAARIRVSDDGCGMDHATQARLFDPFFSTKGTGRGLGLAAVLGIMAGHGGSIDLESSPGAGSEFTLIFPLARAVAETAAVVDREEILIGEWRGQGTILTADDEPSVLKLMNSLLIKLGFEVVSAENGRRAVEVFHEHRDRIRAVLLDFAMPEMNGVEAFTAIRAADPNIPIFMFSGYKEQVAMTELADQNLSGFLHKPFDVERVARMLRTALEDREDAQI